ncbi:MAG: class F sortase [Actinomycetota bacterium]|nr:class F sortase [Actinomycetota bacterium]
MFTRSAGSGSGNRGSVLGYPRSVARAARTFATVAALALLVGLAGGCAGPSSAATSPKLATATATAVATTNPVEAAAVRAVPSAGRGAPVRLRIPAIGVTSSLIRLGLQRDGSLQVPSTAGQAGWFTGAPTPGRLGPAIIVGHVHWNGQAGVFSRLGRLDFGDRILVTRADGTILAFRVTRVSRFAKAHFPTELVYGNIDHSGLRLITCDGFDAAGKAYVDNLVVFAMLDTPT